MEELADDVIGRAVSFVGKNKRVLITLAVILAAVFSGRLIAYVGSNITGPVSKALSDGISKQAFAHAVALGVVSGFGAPGLTMPTLFAMARVVSTSTGATIDAPVLAIAAAINAALTVPDLIVWNSVFARVGSRVLPGGRYVRPFLAGSVPWLISSPALYALAYTAGAQLHALIL